MIEDNSEDHKTLFRVTNKALHWNQDNPLPPGKIIQELADYFEDFFTGKIPKIQIKIRPDPLPEVLHMEQKWYKK